MGTPDLKREYDLLHSDAVRFCEGMKRELEKKFVSYSLTLGIPLQVRVKEWDSIALKVNHKGISLNSVNELDDLVGIRSVFLFRRDLIAARALVKDTFDILSEEDTALRLEDKEFGYQSLHLVVRPPRSWLTVPSFEGCDKLKCELQLRTLAQHIWASASHQLQYKHEESVPKPIRRAIHRASALLETVDLELERVLQEREQYVASVDVQGDEQLNVDSLAHVLNETLPPANKDKGEDYADVLPELLAFGLRTVDVLRAFLHRQLSKAVSEDKKQVEEWRKSADAGDASLERLERNVYFTHAGLVRIMLRAEFGEKYDKYLLQKPLRMTNAALLAGTVLSIPTKKK